MEKKPSSTKRQFYIPSVQWDALVRLKELTGVDASEHVRKALDEYLRRKASELEAADGAAYGVLGKKENP